MSESLILNEASLPFESANDCEQNLDTFFSIIHRANLNGIGLYRADEQEGNWNSLYYAEKFQFGKWLNDISNKDLSLLVKSVISNVKCPLIVLDDVNIINLVKNTLFLLLKDQDIEVRGLGVASLLDTYGISFVSHTHWKENPISILKQHDQDGLVEEQRIEVPNIYTLSHLDDFLNKCEDERQSHRNYFHELSNQDNKDFPNLVFCDSTLKNLKSSSVTGDDFPKIIEALKKLNQAIPKVKNLNELINETELTISGESSETMNTPKHSRKREFVHPTLGKTTFEIHVKNFPDGKRMHILADYISNTICIGYFGRHLSTVSNPK
jgi:hypothetical protein